MKKTLQTTTTREEKRRKSLMALIEKKTRILEELMTKVEDLRIELELISHEYNVRIGGLLLKDNQLDLEILQLKNLKELMRGGMTYSAAMKYEEDAFYSETIRMQKEQEKLDEERKFLDDIQDVSEEVKQSIRVIWKKLIRQFHPDLVTDELEKARREELVKKINKAYSENNLEALQQFEATQDVVLLVELTLEQLEENLEKVEQAIRDTEGDLTVLEKSTWYEWKKKKQKAKDNHISQDIFNDLEKKFLDDIVKKIEIVQQLRVDVHP